jgi:hypothetical protein
MEWTQRSGGEKELRDTTRRVELRRKVEQRSREELAKGAMRCQA